MLTFENEHMSMAFLFVNLFVFAFFIGGLSNLVSTSCSSDLAKSADLTKNAKGGATIIGII